jgi:hypothetical protein
MTESESTSLLSPIRFAAASADTDDSGAKHNDTINPHVDTQRRVKHVPANSASECRESHGGPASLVMPTSAGANRH